MTMHTFPSRALRAALPPGAHALLLIDGDCNLCHAAVRFLIRHDPAGHLAYVPQASPLGTSLLNSSGLPATPGAVILIETTGNPDQSRAWRGSGAMLRACALLQGPVRLLRLGLLLPQSPREWLYQKVARNRQRLSRACRLPTPDERARLLSGELPGTAEQPTRPTARRPR